MSLNTLNFERAQYDGQVVSLEQCSFCGRGIAGEFYRTNGDLTCAICAERIRISLPRDNRAVFGKATAAGGATAAVVCLLYFLLLSFLETHGGGYGVGFAAIGAGYAIGAAMRQAANGAGGRKYQVTAALLTSAAITIAFSASVLGLAGIPVWGYPLLIFAPLMSMIAGQFHLGAIQLLIAGIGMRWAWGLLRSHGVMITGPETLTQLAAGK